MKQQLTYLLIGLIVLNSCDKSEGTLDSPPSLVKTEQIVQVNLKEGYGFNQLDSSINDPLISFSSDTIESGKILSIDKIIVNTDSFLSPEVGFFPEPIVKKVNPSSQIIKGSCLYKTYENADFEKIKLGEDTSSAVLLNSIGTIVPTNNPQVLIEDPIVSNFPTPFLSLPGKKRDQSYIDNLYWDIDQGMSSSHIFKIFQDSRDHIWFGTRDGGAIRFDGNIYSKFGTEEGLTDGLITDIEEDDFGNIWFSTGDGVFIYDGSAFTHYSQEDGIATSTCMGIAKGKHGEMWVATFGAGLLRLELLDEGIDSLELIHYSLPEGLIQNELWPVYVDDEGDVWIGYYNSGVAKVDLDDHGNFISITNYLSINPNDHAGVLDIIQISDGRIALATNYGIVLIQENRRKDKIRVQHLVEETGYDYSSTRSLYYDSLTNILWAGTATGLVKVNLQNDLVELQQFSTNEGLSGNDVRIGTRNAGINRFQLSGFRHLTEEGGISYVGVKSIIERENGDVCVLSPSGMSIFEDGQFFNNPQVQITDAVVNGPYRHAVCLAYTKDGVCFTAGYSGVFRIKGQEHQRFTEKVGLLDHRTHDVLVHSNGKVYFSIFGHGVNELDYRGTNDYMISSLSYLNGIPGTQFGELEEDNLGGLWICSEKGVNIYYPTESGNDSIIHLSTAEGLSSNYTTAIYKDKSGDIWLGTDLGLNYLMLDEFGKPETIKYFTAENGLATNRIRSITQDKDGRMWVATTEGLSVITDYKHNSQIRTFGKKEGLISVDFTPKSMLVDRHNKLWLGSNHALTVLDLNTFELNQESPNPSIDFIAISEKVYNFHDDNELPDNCHFEAVEKFKNLPIGLSLPSQMNHVQIHFSATEWRSPSKIRYSYRIKELNETWSVPSKQNFADYRGLNPGHYTFELISVGADNVWSDSIAYSFEIRPPWWLTASAKVSYFVLSIILILALIRWRTVALRKRQRELEEEVNRATLEIRTQHEEIMDSINYAKRIQTAILPPQKLVKEHLQNSFILYKPKDVVAGDFYWMQTKENTVLFAAADCTGHGVPGAMVSVICNGGLNRSVNEFGLVDPGKILDKTRELVIAEFEKSEDEVKDGMDIALCALHTKSRVEDARKTVLLQYAGAHNSLWIIRKDANEIEQIKADKQPIGKYADEHPFTTHEVKLFEGDTIYLYTDGFADQFGGEKGKKLKAANFKKLLLSMQNEDMDKQQFILNEAFENWRGNLEQLDDVCVVGVRV
jgi:ligand-binding sensor domain-containing protein/serine phosphatase RsbU (regulator of sigma subunit)